MSLTIKRRKPGPPCGANLQLAGSQTKKARMIEVHNKSWHPAEQQGVHHSQENDMPPKIPVKTKATTAKPSGKRVNQAWADLFAENEARVKAGDKPWTDDQLRERMQKAFPDKAEKSTIVRVSMVRSVYNKGTNMFKKFGPAGAKGRPVSKCYNPDGSEGRNAGPKITKKAGAKPTAKPTAKPAKAAKKASSEEVVEVD